MKSLITLFKIELTLSMREFSGMLFGIPLTLSSYRYKKILKRFQITPTSPFTLLMAQFLNQLVFVGISVASVWFIARFIFDYRMIGQLGSFVITFVIFLLSIYSIGMLIASVSKNVNTTNLLCSVLYFPMFFLSGATVPYEIMPKGLQLFANIMPLLMASKRMTMNSLVNQENLISTVFGTKMMRPIG